MGMVGRIIVALFVGISPLKSSCLKYLRISGEQIETMSKLPQDEFDDLVALIIENRAAQGLSTDAAAVAVHLTGKEGFISHPTEGNFLYYKVNFGWGTRHLKTLANKIRRAVEANDSN
jgi:hypothetical protein